MSTIAPILHDLKASILSSGFAGDIISPGDPDYDASLSRFATNAEKKAGLVAFVKSAEDVSTVLTKTSAHNASSQTQQKVRLVVRGGGHSTSGASSSDGGVVIDLSRYLTSVKVDVEKKLGHVGGGANWAAVDEEAIKHGLATTGGTVNHTGVGGFTLGGGYGWLMGQHGMTIDNLVQVTLVTADGSVLSVDATSHPDLFWAIRGGGCNFGCVTEFVYQLYDQSRFVYAGPLVFPPPMLGAVISVLKDWYPTAQPDEAINMITTTKGPTGKPSVVVVVFYNGGEEGGKARFAKFIELGPVVNGAAMMPYEKLNAIANATMTYGANYLFNAVARGPKSIEPEMAMTIFNRLLETVNAPGEAVKNGAAPSLRLIWDFYNLDKMTSIPPDATAFRMREVRPLVIIVANWEGDTVDATADMRKRVKNLKAFMETTLKGTFGGVEGNSGDEEGYGNYEMRDTASFDAAQALFGANYPRLQQLKRKYDPDVVFSAWFPIRPS